MKKSSLLKVKSEKNNTKKAHDDLTIAMFAGGLAHELGNPLDAVRRYVGLALSQSMGEPLSREYLVKAKKGISRITSILHELLIYSKQCYTTKSEIVEIHSLIEKSLIHFREDEISREIVIQKAFSAEKPLHVEDSGIVIVLKNLFDNAVHAMRGRGTLTVETWRQNGSVGVAVQDTGGGIPENLKERIFEPFFTTRCGNGGQGIGLALSREIVERSGGNLCCENISSPVPGTRFLLTLPRKIFNLQ